MIREELASPDDPLVLADGTRIDPSDGTVLRTVSTFVEEPTATNAVEEVKATRRRLIDLPALPQQMNAISIVLTYVTLGLSDKEIAIATKLTEKQVVNIRKTDTYKEVSNQLVESIIANDKAQVRLFLARHQMGAANEVVSSMYRGRPDLRLAAAKDVLDRGGNRPADVVEHRHKMEDSLRIEVIVSDTSDDAPTIDVTPMED